MEFPYSRELSALPFHYDTIHVPDIPPQAVHTLSREVSEVAIDGFGKDFACPEEIQRMLQQEPYLVCARAGDGRLAGFQMQRIFERAEHKFLYYSRAIRKEHQGKSLARGLLTQAIDTLRPSIIAARSQNPVEMLSFLKAARSIGAERIYPFDVAYRDDATARSLLGEIIDELLGRDTDVNFYTGVKPGAFGEVGRLGDYHINSEHPEIARIEKILSEHGLSREQGDAQYYFAIL